MTSHRPRSISSVFGGKNSKEIRDAVEDGKVQIGGTFTEEQAQTIAQQLTAS